MKIPNELKISGHIVKVVLIDDMPSFGGDLGDSWNAYNSVRINTHYPESQQAVTLLHEILHHIMSNLGHSYDKDSKTAIHCEQTVISLAQGLFQVLRDNKLYFGKDEAI